MNSKNVLVIEHTNHSLTGILGACIIGIILSATIVYAGITYSPIRYIMFANVVLVWILVIGFIITDRGLHISRVTTNSLLLHIKTMSAYRKIAADHESTLKKLADEYDEPI